MVNQVEVAQEGDNFQLLDPLEVTIARYEEDLTTLVMYSGIIVAKL